MNMTDPIADLLTHIRNANLAYHEKVEVPASKMKESICKLYIDDWGVPPEKIVFGGLDLSTDFF